MLATSFRAMADLVVVVHVTFVVFVLLGGLLALRWRWLMWLHVPAVVWGIAIEFGGWVCPLTPLEIYLRHYAGTSAYRGDFIEHYIVPLLYPIGLTRGVQIFLGTIALAVNAPVYWSVLRKWFWHATTSPMQAGPRTQLPPRVLPVLYFGVAHLALLLAFAAVAANPRAASGFFYHSRMLAVVHLVTLGWITASILGSLYIVGPIALRLWLPANLVDYTGFGLVLVGIIGMVAHFWIEEYPGMAWSAATVGTGIMVVGGRVTWRLRDSQLPAAVIAHIVLAFLNVLGAATMGTLIGFDKVYHFLPGFVMTNVFAHAHLAAIGWASMMVVGVAYRLLPMVLPAEMPSGARLWISAACLQIGVSGLFVTLLLRHPLVWAFALIVVAGFGAFLSQVLWMLRHRRTKPPGLRTPDPAVLHAAASFASLAIALVLGVWLSIAAASALTLRIAMAYGVFGLVGFLAQLVVGMEGRLLPLFAWYWASANTGYKGPVPSPHDMAWRGGQQIVFVLWLVGVPALAGGLAFDAVPVVAAAAWCLLAATLLDSVNAARILQHAFRAPGTI
jgi:hypothetical protein